jgi:hypothetical protein
MDSENREPTIPPGPEHEYRFSRDDEIASRYQVIAPLGFGGFSEVYHCQDVLLGRHVAIKVLKEMEGMKATRSGLKEARTAARLKHNHIVQVYDVLALEDGTPFIVFDYVAGKTLEAHLNQAQYRRLPLDEDSLRIIHQVSEALDFAHGQRVIHRDIKPSNIILDNQGNAYVTDFGLAEVKRPEGVSVHSAQVERYLSGTIPYMSPEQLKEGKPGDERSDLYALGVVTYEMLTGQLPHRGRDVGLIYQIATSEPLPPTVANPELPKGIEPVLLQALNKDPDKRYPSCLTFARELEEAAQAYVAASDEYEQARKLFRAKQWHDASNAFETLERVAPGFRDTAYYLEQARHQVRLLELYEQAQVNLKQGAHQDALDTLNILTQLAPDYDVANLRKQAREGLAQEEKRTLAAQYEQAVQQFRTGEYQACLDTLAVIRERDHNYPDPEDIEAPAQEKVERQHRLHTLYTQSVDLMGHRQWKEAIATLKKLQQEAPDYEDIETRLAMARYMARMSSLLREAMALLEQEAFTASMDNLLELQRVDADYKRDEVVRLQKEVLNRMGERAKRLVGEGEFKKSLTILAELRELSPDYPGLEELQAQAQEGIRIKDLRAELDGLYRRAVEHLNQRDYQTAFELWQEIQRRRGDLDYPDPRDVEIRTRDGLCTDIYNQALVALGQEDPNQALDSWRQVREVDPHYPDNQQVEERAKAMNKRREKTRWWALRLGGGAIGLLLLGVLVAVIARGCGGAVVPPTATPTWTPSPTATIITATATPSPSSTPTITPTPTRTPSPTTTTTPTPTQTPSPTPTPTRISDPPATALLGSSIFVAPDASSLELGTVRAGEQVPVLARSAHGQWFYIQNDQRVEGFVYAPRFEWTGDFEALPIVASDYAPAPATPTGGPPYASLEMDLWDVGAGWCSGGMWYKRVYIEGQGGNRVYTYYWNGEVLASSTSEGYTFEVHSVGAAIIGTGKVVSGDGQTVERKLFIRVADCF